MLADSGGGRRTGAERPLLGSGPHGCSAAARDGGLGKPNDGDNEDGRPNGDGGDGDPMPNGDGVDDKPNGEGGDGRLSNDACDEPNAPPQLWYSPSSAYSSSVESASKISSS